MKKLLLAVIVLVPLLAPAQDAVEFGKYFVDRTMRIDVFHTGDAKQEMFTVDRVIQEGPWAGNPLRLLMPFELGRYLLRVSDPASGTLVYSKGFDSYFGEYKTTEPGVNGIQKTFAESLLIPFPKSKVRVEVLLRDRENRPQPVFSREIDPADPFIVRETPAGDVLVLEQVKNGPPAAKVDLVILGEGYTRRRAGQVPARTWPRFSDVLFGQEPYKTYRDRFNVYRPVQAVAESGCDEPSYGSFKNTALGCSFDSLRLGALPADRGQPRHARRRRPRALRRRPDHGQPPRYGGGGIYNLYCTFTSDNQWRHTCACTSSATPSAAWPTSTTPRRSPTTSSTRAGVEPLEPNITALLDPENLKWKELVTKKTAVPTPWEKAAYEAMEQAYQKKRQEMNETIAARKRAGAPQAEVDALQAQSEEMSRLNGLEVNAFFKKSRFQGKVGAFEGAGYAAKGLFRPMLDCLMFSRGLRPLCKVCEQAVARTIRYYSEWMKFFINMLGLLNLLLMNRLFELLLIVGAGFGV